MACLEHAHARPGTACLGRPAPALREKGPDMNLATTRPSGGRRTLSAALMALALAVCAALALLCSAPATARASMIYAHSYYGEGIYDPYISIEDAWNAALNGKTVYMDCDWDTGGTTLEVPSGKTATLMMCGFAIRHDYVMRENGSVIKVDDNATLVLDGSTAAQNNTIAVTGLVGLDSREEVTLKTGGLVTGGHSTSAAGGIEMEDGAALKLINVAVAGNKAYSTQGGGVRAWGDGCTVDMTDAQICYNASAATTVYAYGGDGGGVYLGGSNNTLTMKSSSISYNLSENGAGVYCKRANARIEMTYGSKIDHNTDVGSYWGGGGVYFNNNNFHLIGDGTASVSYNTSQKEHGGGVSTGNDSGGEIVGINFVGNRAEGDKAGAIYADSSEVTVKACNFSENYSKGNGGAIYSCGQDFLVEACTFKENSTASRGGAVYLDSRYAKIVYCQFTGNEAGWEGGAVYNAARYNLIQDCTVTGNKAGNEGGGVFTSFEDNIYLDGVVRIYGNTRGSGGADDLFMNENAGCTIYAYATSNSGQYKVAAGSRIGVRTGMTTKRFIAEELSDYVAGSYFLDLFGDFHLEYVSSEQKLYQMPNAATYKVTVNGQGNAKYDQGSSATVDANKYADGKVFWRWDASASTGLWNIADLLKDDASNPKLTVSVPGNDVNLVAVYVAYLGKVRIDLDAPAPGEELPTAATLTYTPEGAEAPQTVQVGVTWAKVSGNKTELVSGKAEFSTAYMAKVELARDFEKGLVFSEALDAANAPVYLGGSAESCTRGVSVGDDGALAVTTQAYTTRGKGLVSVADLDAVSIRDGGTADSAAGLVPTTLAGKLEDGSDAVLGLDVAGIDWAKCVDASGAAMVDADGCVVEPSADEATHAYKVAVGVTAPAGVEVPEGLATVELEVVVSHHARTVSFHGADGELLSQTSVEWGDAVAQPDDPTLEGHVFAGWYLDGAQDAYAFSAPVKDDLDLTARWDQQELMVTFSAEGAVPAVQTVTVKWGETVAAPETTPVKDHETFVCWQVEGTGEAYDFTAPVTSDLTLVASWTPLTHKVLFYLDNGQDPLVSDVAHGQCARKPAAPSREGYVFAGWYTVKGEAYDFTAPVVEDVYLAARWDTGEPTSFDDVAQGTWYYDYVTQAASLGLMTGYRNGSDAFTGDFGPEDTLTRGQVATVLWRIAGYPEPTEDAAPFPDVDDPAQFYYKAVAWCSENGIITGFQGGQYDGLFRPGDAVSREQLALMVYRFEQFAGAQTTGAPTDAFDQCVDRESVSSWARDAMVWSAAANVLSGKDTAEGVKRLDPQQTATRAQAAKIFVRAYLIAWGMEEPYQFAVGDDGVAGADMQAAQAEATFDEVATFEAAQAADEQAGETVEAAELAGETAEAAGSERPASDGAEQAAEPAGDVPAETAGQTAEAAATDVQVVEGATDSQDVFDDVVYLEAA